MLTTFDKEPSQISVLTSLFSTFVYLFNRHKPSDIKFHIKVGEKATKTREIRLKHSLLRVLSDWEYIFVALGLSLNHDHLRPHSTLKEGVKNTYFLRIFLQRIDLRPQTSVKKRRFYKEKNSTFSSPKSGGRGLFEFFYMTKSNFSFFF